MKRSNDETAGLTRRALLARATASALTASAAVAASGCAAEPPPIPSNEANLTPWTKSNFLAVLDGVSQA
jgi:hypothetical protein